MSRSTIGEEVPFVTYTDHDTVLAVQKALKAKGLNPGPLDGAYGPKTAAAVKQLQEMLGTIPTGKIDPSVLLLLQISPPKEKQKSTEARQLQTSGEQGDSSFLSREAFAGLKVWQVTLLTVGLGAVSYGAYKLLK